MRSDFANIVVLTFFLLNYSIGFAFHISSPPSKYIQRCDYGRGTIRRRNHDLSMKSWTSQKPQKLSKRQRNELKSPKASTRLFSETTTSVQTEKIFDSVISRRSLKDPYQLQELRVILVERILPVSAGTVVALVLLYSIAMIGEEVRATSWQEFIDNVQLAYQNTYDAIAPLGISDIMSVIVGESTAAIVAAVASSFILLSLKLPKILPQSAISSQSSKPNSNVVADGDFLLTKAAAVSLLNSIGIPPTLAKLFSSLLATLPYGIVQLGSRRRDQMKEEDRILDELLEEKLKREEIDRVQVGVFASSFSATTEKEGHAIADTERFVPVQEKKAPALDGVEVFSDITKWLQYDVFCTKFGESLIWNDQNMFPGFEAAVFGAVSCLSAQIYCDILYAFFNLGGTVGRDKVVTRSYSDWFSLYVSQILYGAALFVTYEAFQIPARWILDAFLSGGVDGCIGSPAYSACIDTFIELNSPEDTPEEEIYSRISPILASFETFFVSIGLTVP